MSVAAIQDSLVKSSLVQHTQSKNDDVSRSQQISAVQDQKEQDRQVDQVVIRSREAEQNGVRDEEKQNDGRRKRKEEEQDGKRVERREDGEEEDEGPRARMRVINIVV